MSLKNVGDYEESYNMSTTQHSAFPTQPLLSRNNPIQLAAISNYKLAQLTFSAPDWNSMRKTALIKNMADVIYMDTPPEWLDQMRRWQFFTPESLSNMTQDGLEHIFGQYIQTMEAFKPINLNDDEDDDDEDDEDEDDELWPDDEIQTPNDLQPALYNNGSTSSTSVPVIMEYPLYAHSGASLSAELLTQKDLKPLPDRPTSPTSTTLPTRRTTTPASERKQQHRKSMTKMRNRLSWTSDTGLLANSAMGQTWTNELMTMFNMEFQVDTSLNLNTTTAPAPTLPELPFSARHNQQKRQSHRKSQRYSTDSFMNLIPAFESFKLEEPMERRSVMVSRSKTITFPPPPPTTPPPPHLMAGSISSPCSSSRQRSSSQPEIYQHHSYSPTTTTKPPMRSSSLKIKPRSRSRSRSISANDSPPKGKSSADTLLNGLVNTFGGGTTIPGEKRSLSKKKSIRRLASLVAGTKSKYGHNGENHNKNNGTGKQSSPAAETTTICISSPSPTNSLNRTSNIYQTPISPTHNSAPMNTSHLSIASTAESSVSTHSILMVATKTPILQYKPLPDIPSSCTNDDDQRRTSYTMARPVIVELSDLRRSRSTGSRPMKKRHSLKWKQRRRSEEDVTPTTTCPSFRPPDSIPTTNITNAASSSSLAAALQPSSYTLYDPPMEVNTTSPRPKRSKSTLRRIGSGLSKQHKKILARKNDSVPPLVNETDTHTPSESSNNTLVKRMVSFRKRMRLQRG